MSGTDKTATLRAVMRASLHHRAAGGREVSEQLLTLRAVMGVSLYHRAIGWGCLSSCLEDSSIQQSLSTEDSLSGELVQGPQATE